MNQPQQLPLCRGVDRASLAFDLVGIMFCLTYLQVVSSGHLQEARRERDTLMSPLYTFNELCILMMNVL